MPATEQQSRCKTAKRSRFGWNVEEPLLVYRGPAVSVVHKRWLCVAFELYIYTEKCYASVKYATTNKPFSYASVKYATTNKPFSLPPLSRLFLSTLHPSPPLSPHSVPLPTGVWQGKGHIVPLHEYGCCSFCAYVATSAWLFMIPAPLPPPPPHPLISPTRMDSY